jgi:hypothetical protein
MDINLFFRVIRRFRILIAIGVLVAALLAVLSFAKVTSSGLVYRQPKQWSSTQQLSVSTNVPIKDRVNNPIPDAVPIAQEYATLATSNAVAPIIRRDAGGKPPGKLLAQDSPNSDGSASRLFELEGIATSNAAAVAMAQLSTRALLEYLPVYNATNYPPPNEVKVTRLGGPTQAKIVKSPSKTRPIFVFLAVLLAFIGLAFILENMRPAVRVQPPREEDDDTTRRVAPPLRASDRSR